MGLSRFRTLVLGLNFLLALALAAMIGTIALGGGSGAPAVAGGRGAVAGLSPSAPLSFRPLSAEECGVIVKRDLFRTAAPAGTEAPPADELPVDANMQLIGTVASDGGGSLAVLSLLADKSQGIFRVGDSVLGARIERIEPRRIWLSVGGQSRSLELTSGPEGGAHAAPADRN